MYQFNYTNSITEIYNNLELFMSLKTIKEIVPKEEFGKKLKNFKTKNFENYCEEGYNKFIDLFIECFSKLNLDKQSKIIIQSIKKDKDCFLEKEMSILFDSIKNKNYNEQKKVIFNKIKELDSINTPSIEKMKNILKEYNQKDYYDLFFDDKILFKFYND